MVMGLQPLEFKDCILDSPDFRDNLNRHEKELEKSSQHIKRIIKEVKDLLATAKNLSRAQRALSKSLAEFNFECIGSTTQTVGALEVEKMVAQTDDEQVIADSLKQFGKLISAIEEERDNMLERAHDQIVRPLEEFRKKHIGGVKENKKKFDKKTAKFCQAQERFLNMSTKKPGNAVVEADASLGMLEREYFQESLSYVLGIQEVQERIKFEFVEILLSFISGWLVFYHLGHEVAEDAKDYLSDLQFRVQKTRENFDETRSKAEELKKKFMDSKAKPESEFTKQGYLYLMEKKAFTATWIKYYCTYKKQTKEFSMLQYNQISGKTQSILEEFNLASCTRRQSEFEKRFCFDLTFDQRPATVYTFQALNEEDRKSWLNAMDGKEPTYLNPGGVTNHNEDGNLDDVGFAFVRKCIETLERRGLEEEGLYRIGGVSTKITKLLNMGMDRKKVEKDRLTFFNDDQYADILESKTIASALKHYLRHLNEPLTTFRYHNGFISAAKQDVRLRRINEVHTLIYKLPKPNFDMMDLVIKHLKAVSQKSDKNKMSVFNLGVIFGPTLIRSPEETLAAILDIKFNNVVIEIMIENYDRIFRSFPEKSNDNISSTSPSMLMHRNQWHKRNVRNSIYSQPVVRVVAKSNYTDPLMSSVQNNTNGISAFKASGYYGTYDAKPVTVMSTSSTPSLHRDNTREVNFLKQASSNIAVNTHNSISPPSHSNTSYSIMRNVNSDINLSGSRKELSVYDRINSMSSSNESVCSTSSRDINLSLGRQLNWDYSNVNQQHQSKEDESSQTFLPADHTPKKTQRAHKLVTSSKHEPSLRVRTLYACLAENDGELSFEPNQIITNVRRSNEPGWLEGTLNGKSGLIPENYVEVLK